MTAPGLVSNPYEDLPYRSLAIEWTAPERLALTSLLHGGPRPPLDRYRVLELGCGDGANLIPLAYYRPQAELVGVDGAESAIAVARARAEELSLRNLQLVAADFLVAADALSGQFDFIIAHGIFSWVSEQTRDALFALCAARLRPGGLLYLNYNAKPGWNVRGMVRELLLAETAASSDLAARAQRARAVAATVAASLAAAGDHPYTRLLEQEFRFVCESHVSYVAHEFLAPHNRAYWRRDFLAVAARYGFDQVADADFNYASGRVPEELAARVAASGLLGQPPDDTVDLLCYRQLHSPIFTARPWTRRPPERHELAALVVASCLAPLPAQTSGPRMFRHPTGFEVEAKEPGMGGALERLWPLWPRGVTAGVLFPQREALDAALGDLRLLHTHGLIELRMAESDDRTPPPGPLNQREARWTGFVTTPYHTRLTAP